MPSVIDPKTGLFVPRTTYPGLEEHIAGHQVLGISPTAIPVIVIADATERVAGQQSTPAITTINITQGTAPASTPLGGGRGYMCHLYSDEGAAGAVSYEYIITCPAGQLIEFHTLWMVMSASAAGTCALRVSANPLAGLTAAKGAGNLNYMADTFVTATTTKAMHIKSPRYAAAAANAPFALTSNLDNPDGGTAAAAAPTPTRELWAPLVLYPGGQVSLKTTCDGVKTHTALRWAGVFEVFYL